MFKVAISQFLQHLWGTEEPFDIRTNYLICSANQMTGFYKKYNTDLLNVLISSTRKIKISKEITKKGAFPKWGEGTGRHIK